MMRIVAAVLCYLALVLPAFLGCHSTAEWLLLGVAPVLLLDRLAFRLFPWPQPAHRARQAARRLLWFGLGLVAFGWLWPARLAWAETLRFAAELSLAAFIAETAAEGVLWMWRRCRPWAKSVGSPPSVWLWLVLALFFLMVAAPLGALHPPHSMPGRTPAAHGFAFEDVELRTSDNVVLRSWLVPHAQARGNVVFCHGIRSSRGQVMSFLKTLHELRLNVLAFDFRGHGDSPGHTVTFGHHETRDVAAAAVYLRERFPDRPLFIIGVSYGAGVALQALPDLPEVRAVWVEAPFAQLTDPVNHFFRPVPSALRPMVVGFYAALAWADCGFWMGDISPLDRLEQVQVPICFCHGRADNTTPFENGQKLYDAYGGPKSCLWIDDGTHNDLRSRHKELYFAQLRGFLEEHLKRGRGGE
jgi:alpha-beta hydrolase superfamily lysophospholipase